MGNQQPPPFNMEDEAKRIKDYVLHVYDDAAADPVTAPAAFGVCCAIIRLELNCTLMVAAMLMECWLSSRKLENDAKDKG